MEWFVILVIIGFLGIVFFLNLKILFYYEHPDDSKYSQGLTAKVTALVGFELVWLLLTVVPTDAFNSYANGGFNVELLWKLVLVFNLVYLIFPVAFATSFYEADTDPRTAKTSAWFRAMKFSLIVLVCCAAVVAVMYFALRWTKAEVCNGEGVCEMVPVKTPFFVFSAILIGFFGWILLVVYLGVGLIAVPQGLIVGFITRPKPISLQDYHDAKVKLAEQIVALKAVGEDLRERQVKVKAMSQGLGKWNAQRLLRNNLNKFRQSVHLIDDDFKALNTSFKQRGENPFFSYAKMAVGCLCAALSIIWYTHIILYILLPQILGGRIVWGFLDQMFMGLSQLRFYALDLILYAFFVGYLMLSQMIGCFRFNMRMFCCFSIHPMKKNDTHLNSILFNTCLTVVSAHAILHLSYISFREYCRGTYAEMLYGQWAANTVVLGEFYKNNVFVWTFVIVGLICLIFFAVKPRDQIAFSLDRIKKMKFTSKAAKEAPKREADEAPPEESGVGLLGGIDTAAEKKMGQIEKTMKFFV